MLPTTDRVPNELWLEILKNLPQYDKSTVEAFALTCRAFRLVSRPRLFSDLRFTTYRRNYHGDILLPSPKEVDRCLERLNFWCSAEIAPFVRYCDITASERASKSSEWSFSTDSPYILLDALFERLVLFTGLQRLHAHYIHFTQARVDIICRLPSLSELGVYWCTAASGHHIDPSPQALRVSDFRIVYNIHDTTLDDYWIPLLHTDHLQALRTNFNPLLMGRTIHAIPSFRNVRELDAAIDLPTSSENLAILSEFPAVRILKLWGKGSLTDVVSLRQASPVYPLLTNYSGLYQPLPLFLPNSTLKHLSLRRCSPQHLINCFQGIHGQNITSLQAEFNQLNNATFNSLLTLFPRLTELLIRIVVSDSGCWFSREIYDDRDLQQGEIVDGRYGDSVRAGFKVSKIFIALSDAAMFPPSLTRLAISWECYEEFYSELSAYIVPDFPKLRDALVARCPELNWLWFDGYYFMFEWRDPMPDGTVKEVSEKDFLGAYGHRQGAEIFWGCHI